MQMMKCKSLSFLGNSRDSRIFAECISHPIRDASSEMFATMKSDVCKTDSIMCAFGKSCTIRRLSAYQLHQVNNAANGTTPVDNSISKQERRATTDQIIVLDSIIIEGVSAEYMFSVTTGVHRF